MPNITVLACDDIRMEINGKPILIGVYTANILIPTDEFIIPQLQFFFSVDTLRDEVPNKIAFEVKLPGGVPPIRNEADFPTPQFKDAHTRWIVRHVIGFRNVPLYLGRIEASVSLDDTVYPAAVGWIEKMELASEPVAVTPTA